MASAEIITIGTELLLGDILDTNTRYIAQQLRQMGVNLYRTTTVGDNPLRIAEAFRESLNRCDIVIATGGLGPTVDDPTRSAAALAYNVDIEFHPELWQQISERFSKRSIIPTENNRKQAFLPFGATALHNPVGTAPAFYLGNIPGVLICLPGVPAEMETIFQRSVIPLLRNLIGSQDIIKTRVLHTCGMGESSIDALVNDLETMANPTVGLCAHPGIVDIRVTAKASSESEVNALLSAVENEIRKRVPNVIFGIDELTLAHSIENIASKSGKLVKIILTGFSPHIEKELGFSNSQYVSIDKQEINPQSNGIQLQNENFLVLGVNLTQTHDVVSLDLHYIDANGEQVLNYSYNGPTSMAETWAINTSLGKLWKELTTTTSGE